VACMHFEVSSTIIAMPWFWCIAIAPLKQQQIFSR
jgi:hypothetical protein